MLNKKMYIWISLLIVTCIVFGSTVVYADSNNEVNYEEINSQIENDVDKYHIPGMAVVVVNKDEVLFSETYGDCESLDTPFIIGSMSKSFTALSIMQLVEDGKIDIDKPISEYIDASPWFVDDKDCDKITVRDLLHHTSGITTYQTFGELEITDSYGKYVYSNANYGLLGLIIESVSGVSYEEYVNNNVFEPLDMNHSDASLEQSKKNGLIDGYRNYFGIPVAGEPDYPGKIKEGTWTNIPAGYLSSSINDMGRYMQMYLNAGEGIIGEKSINSMFYENVSSDDGTFYYGMGWQYTTELFSQPVLWHSGLVENYTSNMFILPEEGIAVVVLVNMNDYLVGNNLLSNVVMPLIGEKHQNTPNWYVIGHVVFDTVYLLLFFASIYSAVTMKKWSKKEKTIKLYVIDSIRHIVLPIILLCIPIITGTPIEVLWLFVKDLCLVINVNVGILIIVGVVKLLLLVTRKKQNIEY